MLICAGWGLVCVMFRKCKCSQQIYFTDAYFILLLSFFSYLNLPYFSRAMAFPTPSCFFLSAPLSIEKGVITWTESKKVMEKVVPKPNISSEKKQ